VAVTHYVKRGIKLLDQAKPGWWRPGKIDLGRLDLSSCSLCVLGQLYNGKPGGYARGLEALTKLAAEGKLRVPRSWFDLGPYFGEKEILGARIGCDIPDDLDDIGYEDLTALWDAEIRARRRAAKLRVN
jgi:hypothetical protein